MSVAGWACDVVVSCASPPRRCFKRNNDMVFADFFAEFHDMTGLQHYVSVLAIGETRFDVGDAS